MKKIVVIGGGTGLSTILEGIKNVEDIEISAIVSVADDGGSTGKITKDFHLPAVGDIRRVLVSLSQSSKMLESLMNHRFIGVNDVSGHALGNLMIVGMYDITRDFYLAIESIAKILNVSGNVIPISDEVMVLYAKMKDGVIVKGESNIPKYHNQIKEVYYTKEYQINPKAIQAILEADEIILGIGSLYTSILSTIIHEPVKEALKQTKGRIIYMCNGMTQPGETDGYSVEDHVNAIVNHIGHIVDLVVVNQSEFSEEIINIYLQDHSEQVLFNEKMEHHYKVVIADLMSEMDGYLRHHPLKVGLFIDELIRGD